MVNQVYKDLYHKEKSIAIKKGCSEIIMENAEIK